MTGWIANEIKGLTPAVEPRRSENIFALGGQNFIFDSIGPKSAFGNRYIDYRKFPTPKHAQGIKLRVGKQDRTFSLFPGGIYEWDEQVGGWKVLYVTPNTGAVPYRWTHAYLNGYVFFCHPRVGIVYLDVEADRLLKFEVEGAPGTPIAICENNGRLCVINQEIFGWSGPSDGFDWEPKLGGSGFQKISDRTPGDPIIVTSTSEAVLTWTTGGVMRGQFTNEPEVYNFRSINTDYIPVSSFCCVRIDRDKSIILDERGLFESDGNELEPFSPAFNEFLLEKIKTSKLTLDERVRLEWNSSAQLLYVMTAENTYEGTYNKTYALYVPLDQWGTFDEITYGILPVIVNRTVRENDYFSFIDKEGRVKHWLATGSRETIPSLEWLNYSYPVVQKPAHPNYGNVGETVSSSGKLNTAGNTSGLVPSGYYLRDGNSKSVTSLTGLDASITIGFIRFSGEKNSSEIAEINSLSLGNHMSEYPGLPTDDYAIDNSGVSYVLTIENTEYTISGVSINWLDSAAIDDSIGDTAIDYGQGDINYINHQLTVIGSIDGYTPYEEMEPTLTIMQPGIRHFDLSVAGVWFSLVVSAESVGEAFHVKSINTTSVAGGSLL